MRGNEATYDALARWRDLELLQSHYAEFDDFMVDVIEGFMRFTCTEIQTDIGAWVAYGPQYRMVQAQRGQAKTTITAIYAVWRLIHDPTTRVLILSAGGDMATEIANWIIQIIMGMSELECLRPDRAAGDRSGVDAFDVHHSLKGPEKSPSVACIGITANMQGRRADLLIADDIESTKNSQTATQRIRLHHLTLDFSSICSNGDIVWLGTPQSVDSLYNSLPGRGTQIRVWPGRYPTEKEEADYEGFLAPLIVERLAANPNLRKGGGPTGDRGQPIDPVLLGEEALLKKEVDQGPAYFNLQHMLSTKLSDQDRYPLKVGYIRFLNWDTAADILGKRNAPMTLSFVRTEENSIKLPDGYPIRDKMYSVQKAEDFGAMTDLHMYIDPGGGGQNGDETAYAISGFMAGRVHIFAVGGVPGGITDEQLAPLVQLIKKWQVRAISIEQNFGNGALASVLRRLLLLEKLVAVGVEDVWESGQKELRIIDILEPVLGAGKLVIHQEVIQTDFLSIQKYPGDNRQTYSLFWQMARITRDKKSLLHEDRLDALAGTVRYWVDALSQDEMAEKVRAANLAYENMMRNPKGDGRPMPGLSPSLQATSKYGIGKIGRLGR